LSASIHLDVYPRPAPWAFLGWIYALYKNLISFHPDYRDQCAGKVSIHLDVYPQRHEHSWDGNVRYTTNLISFHPDYRDLIPATTFVSLLHGAQCLRECGRPIVMERLHY
jgi:hypothetical protein